MKRLQVQIQLQGLLWLSVFISENVLLELRYGLSLWNLALRYILHNGAVNLQIHPWIPFGGNGTCEPSHSSSNNSNSPRPKPSPIAWLPKAPEHCVSRLSTHPSSPSRPGARLRLRSSRVGDLPLVRLSCRFASSGFQSITPER